MKNAIDIKGVSKTYRDFTLDSLTLSLPEGSIMGLIGENGAGKSTTIKLIMNAILPDSGSIEVLGMDNKSPEFAEAKEDIAVALSHDPKLLVLDEATGGLDPIVRDEILDIFNDFTRDESHSILISSHIVSDLEKICDYIAFLHRGRLVFAEEKDMLYENYALVNMTKTQLSGMPKGSVLGSRENSYGAEVLMLRSDIPAGMVPERITIEDIMLYMAREER